jgi:hypothetical protein
MPPTIGAAMSCMTFEPVPVPTMMGKSPATHSAHVRMHFRVISRWTGADSPHHRGIARPLEILQAGRLALSLGLPEAVSRHPEQA